MSTAASPIVDVCGSPHGAAGWAAILHGLRTDAPDFVATFGGALARAAGLSARTIRAQLEREPGAAIEALAGGLAVDVDAHVERLRALGVRRQAIHGAWYRLPAGGTVNDEAIERAARHPDVLEAWCAVDVRTAADGVTQVDRCADAGGRGVVVLPFLSRIDAESPAAHAVYDRASERGLPVWLHCGYSAARDMPMTTPAQLDRIAARHQGLTLIAGHGGWPYVAELIAVLMRQPNVFVDTSAHDPGRMGTPGSGWEPLLHHLPGIAGPRVLFGGATHVHGTTLDAFVAGVRKLGLPEPLEAAWLHDNAARVLRLDAAVSNDHEEQEHGLARA